MSIQASFVSCQLSVVVASTLALLLGAHDALAAAPPTGLGWNNKVAISAHTKQNTHEKLTTEEAEFWKDKAELEQLEAKIRPLCMQVATDLAQDCKDLSAAELKASYPGSNIGGIGTRYRVSKEEFEILNKRKVALEKKWSGE